MIHFMHNLSNIGIRIASEFDVKEEGAQSLKKKIIFYA